MNYKDILADLRSIENIKTHDIDKYNKKLIKAGADVSSLKRHVLKEQILHRTYFQVPLGQMNDSKVQLQYIEDNAGLLQDWWHVDQLTQFMIKPMDFDYSYNKAKQYIVSDMPFLRRWGYVLFLTGLQQDASHTNDILELIKDDDEYYVQMAEAWLIADLAVFNISDVKKFMKSTTIKYNISGKAIQKMCDSFRISPEDKEYMKSLRPRLKQM